MVSEKRKNILLVTLSNIGDVVLTTPVISSLYSNFPGARITVVVGPRAAGLLRGSRQIERLLVYDKESGWREKLGFVRELRKEAYDWVVDLKNSALPFLVRAHRRSPMFRSFRSKSARGQHLEVLEKMGLLEEVQADSLRSPRFDFFSEADETNLSEKLNKKGRCLSSSWVVVAPGAGSEAKRWRIEGFCEVADRLLEASSFNMAVVGDVSEKLLGAKLAEIDSSRILNLTGETTLRELAALVSRAKLILSNDSACMHLGYELARPVVALFGPTDHVRYGREDTRWRIVRDPVIEKIPAQKVFEACSQLLNPAPSF